MVRVTELKIVPLGKVYVERDGAIFIFNDKEFHIICLGKWTSV